MGIKEVISNIVSKTKPEPFIMVDITYVCGSVETEGMPKSTYDGWQRNFVSGLTERVCSKHGQKENLSHIDPSPQALRSRRRAT